MSGKEKLEGEGTPPINKRSMVSEEDLVKRIKELNKSENKPEELIPDPKILQLFMAEQLYDMNEKLGELLTIFKGAKIEEKAVAPSVPVAPSKPEKVSQPPTSRVTEISDAFEKFGDLVDIDTESSAQFVIVKPKKYLKDDWGPINEVAVKLAGSNCWQSQGKESHWLIPKMTKGKGKVEAPKEVPSGVVSGLEKIKMTFPDDLLEMLTFTESDGYVIVNTRKFLGADNFAKIASIVRSLNGEYISAGKQSHFKVPIPK